MNYSQIVAVAVSALFSKVISFRLGSYQVTASAGNGAPVHFTFGTALAAGELVLEGKVGSFSVGSVNVSIAPLAA